MGRNKCQNDTDCVLKMKRKRFEYKSIKNSSYFWNLIIQTDDKKGRDFNDCVLKMKQKSYEYKSIKNSSYFWNLIIQTDDSKVEKRAVISMIASSKWSENVTNISQ